MDEAHLLAKELVATYNSLHLAGLNLAGFMLLSWTEYVNYIDHDVLPDDFVERHGEREATCLDN